MSKQIKAVKDTGFGESAAKAGNRLIGKDGVPNVIKTGVPFWEKFSSFHTLLNLNIVALIAYTFIVFIIINFIFTGLYFIFGIHQLNGINPVSGFDKFLKVFFFSIQTFTTVGYGHISPATNGSSALAAIEAFCGLLFFAIVTGLMFARFSKPKAFIKFSKVAVIAPYEGKSALMFRMVPFKNNQLINARVRMNLSIVKEINGVKRTEFFTPKLEIDRVNSLVLSWTVVHAIDEESPIFGFTKNDFETSHFEMLIFLEAFDEIYSNTVVAKTSYVATEVKCGYKFEPMYERSYDGNSTILKLDKLNSLLETQL